MRDAFPEAVIHFVEKIGALNRQSFKRVLFLQDCPFEEQTFSTYQLESHYSDSMSQLGTYLTNEKRNPTTAVSVDSRISENSQMSLETSSRTLEIPPGTNNPGKRFCYVFKRFKEVICNKKHWA